MLLYQTHTSVHIRIHRVISAAFTTRHTSKPTTGYTDSPPSVDSTAPGVRQRGNAVARPPGSNGQTAGNHFPAVCPSCVSLRFTTRPGEFTGWCLFYSYNLQIVIIWKSRQPKMRSSGRRTAPICVHWCAADIKACVFVCFNMIYDIIMYESNMNHCHFRSLLSYRILMYMVEEINTHS